MLAHWRIGVLAYWRNGPPMPKASVGAKLGWEPCLKAILVL
jgi:hypothetical protein